VLLLAIALVASPGCDWLLEVDAEVRVDPLAQQAVTSWPQEVLLRHEKLTREAGPAAYRIAVLCEASAQPAAATWHFDDVNGCGRSSTITAWLEPLDPAAGLPCGNVGGYGKPVDPGRRPTPESPSASVRVFESGRDCPRSADVVLTIAPAP
jgi:hypothetical protein